MKKNRQCNHSCFIFVFKWVVRTSLGCKDKSSIAIIQKDCLKLNIDALGGQQFF